LRAGSERGVLRSAWRWRRRGFGASSVGAGAHFTAPAIAAAAIARKLAGS
jgi:hypothetical protein